MSNGGPAEPGSRTRRERRPRPSALAALAALAALGLALAGPARAERGAELGVHAGVVLPDQHVMGRPGTLDNLEPLAGVRGCWWFAGRAGWFVDADFFTFEAAPGLGDAESLTARTGIELLSAPFGEDYQTLVAFGAGRVAVGLDDADDLDRTFVSLGLGQRYALGSRIVGRWEVRGDHTVDSADETLGDGDLTTARLTFGLVWGTADRDRDADADGVADRRDLCPATPAGAVVDVRGCPLDSDRDGVLDGIDLCPATPAGWAVDRFGCTLDSDGDRVPDAEDDCPGTAPATPVNERGCPLDADGDGVVDGADDCPGTIPGAIVDARGCPLDADGDTVPDGVDRCPRTPRFAHVDALGCPSDDDGDGVLDGLDRCPTTAPATPVDEHGCPRAPQLFEEERRTLVLEGVRFETGSAQLTADSRDVLDLVARSLLDWPSVRVEIAGHTDAVGSEASNLRLSQQRADAVRDWLVARGVDPGRLVGRGYGESEPIDDNDTPGGRARNRRVELRRLDAAGP